MALSAGTRLGPYEILEPLGAGGMGEVYRARDTRLDRTVALKVLPAELAADPQLRARFEREARAISALAHPNICTLHDVGEQDGRTFLVMEHLVGQTLAERLKKGRLPLDKALEVATQIADALAAAHKQGIVHRDLKPGNVMLTKTGARLLDFGLARLTGHGAQPAVESLTSAPTEPEPLTGRGTVMGTLPYMAPEQVEGKPADARTDIWALGAILYEMLSGERAFQASSPVSLVGAILEREPAPISERQPLTPPSLERLVRRCLAKDPEDRWDTAHDVADELRWIGEVQPEAKERRIAPAWGSWTIPMLAAVALVVFLSGVLVDRLWLRPQESPQAPPVIRSHIDLTAERPLLSPSSLHHPNRTELAVSPDARLMVWAARPDGGPERSTLHLWRLDTGEVTRLPGAEGGSQPFFSPDGRWIGFSVWESDERTWLRKVPVEGGLAVDLAELPWLPAGATWQTDGRILLGSPQMGIHSVPVEGGPAREITTVDPARETGHRLPSILPGGRTLLMTILPHVYGVKARVEAVSLDDGEREVVVEDGADARYLPTGHLVFARRGTLMAARFDLGRLELTGPPVPVVEGVSQALIPGGGSLVNSGAAQFVVSESGILVYAPGGIALPPPVELLLVDEKGRAEALPGFDKPLVSPQMRYSPDGRQLAFVEQVGSGLLWLFDVERHTYRPLSDRGVAASPCWSPDGTRLVVGWSEAGPFKLWMVPASGREDWTRLTEGEHDDWAPSWSPDGRFLAFVRGGRPLMDIYLYQFEDQQVVPFLTSPAEESHPEFSPDGRWLAYRSNESGRIETYVTSFPGRDQTFTVSREGGYPPAWSRDGRRLFYHSLGPSHVHGPRRMMSVTVRQDPDLSLGRPTLICRLPEPFVFLWPMRDYELHPDGRRFLVGRFIERDFPPPITRLTLVHNWFTELERLAPVQ